MGPWVREHSDEVVLKHAIRGDRDAFGVLYERYINRIYSYVYYRTGNIHEAEDLTERVFMRAMRHIGNYTDRGLPFSAWLYRIAHNLVANWYRDNSRRREVSLDERLLISGFVEHPESNLIRIEERELLMYLIRRLSADRQQLIILKFVDQMTNAEIGKIMGRTEGAIKSLYHRTLLALRDDIHRVLELYDRSAEDVIMEDWMQAAIRSDVEV